MEASALQAPVALGRTRLVVGVPLLRLRSDEQLVALFRAGHDEAFGAIYERYHKRLLAYARQMLPVRQDAEDALQDVFVRAYSGLRANDGELALRAWLFKVAHNRCIDELRRPACPPPEVAHLMRAAVRDPIAQAEHRESLRRLIADVRRLPEQQRAALLLRELGGMSYADLACTLDVTVGAVKSLLVRARMGLADAAQARDTDCAVIREEIVAAHDRGSKPTATVRKHMRECTACRGFRREVRGISRGLAAIVPAGPLTTLAQVLGFSGGAGGGATAGGATATGAATGATAGGASAAAGSGVAIGATGTVIGAGHVATLIVAAVATAGGATLIQHTIATTAPAAQIQSSSGHHAALSSAAVADPGLSPAASANTQLPPPVVSIPSSPETGVAAASVASVAVGHLQTGGIQPQDVVALPAPAKTTAVAPPATPAPVASTTPAAAPVKPTSTSTTPPTTTSSSVSTSTASTTTAAPTSSGDSSSSSKSAPAASGSSPQSTTESSSGTASSSTATSGSGTGNSSSDPASNSSASTSSGTSEPESGSASSESSTPSSGS